MKQLKGKVINAKMKNTVTVLVKHLWQHPLYKKRVTKSKKYLVDDNLGVKIDDKVIIEECRPISKKKRFKVIKKLSN